MRFQNREQAANLLAEKLAEYKGKNPLVLGIPRGAVPMARIIADALGGDLDVVLVHKLGAPGEPELAIGAVDETGHVYLGEYARAVGISASYIKKEKEAQLKILRQRLRFILLVGRRFTRRAATSSLSITGLPPAQR